MILLTSEQASSLPYTFFLELSGDLNREHLNFEMKI